MIINVYKLMSLLLILKKKINDGQNMGFTKKFTLCTNINKLFFKLQLL